MLAHLWAACHLRVGHAAQNKARRCAASALNQRCRRATNIAPAPEEWPVSGSQHDNKCLMSSLLPQHERLLEAAASSPLLLPHPRHCKAHATPGATSAWLGPPPREKLSKARGRKGRAGVSLPLLTLARHCCTRGQGCKALALPPARAQHASCKRGGRVACGGSQGQEGQPGEVPEPPPASNIVLQSHQWWRRHGGRGGGGPASHLLAG